MLLSASSNGSEVEEHHRPVDRVAAGLDEVGDVVGGIAQVEVGLVADLLHGLGELERVLVRADPEDHLHALVLELLGVRRVVELRDVDALGHVEVQALLGHRADLDGPVLGGRAGVEVEQARRARRRRGSSS